VRIKLDRDGRKVLYNESTVQRARRLAPALVPIPDADLGELIDRYAKLQGLDPKLVRAVVQAESGFNVAALSNKGAMGLMQLMPATAAELAVRNPWNAEENIRGGTTYLRGLLDLFQGQVELALAGYNAGPAAVERYGGVPPYAETRGYIERILRMYRGDASYALPGEAPRRGRKTYVVRGPGDRITLTTSPAGR
jgi:soluble lytic murein transglycosylase